MKMDRLTANNHFGRKARNALANNRYIHFLLRTLDSLTDDSTLLQMMSFEGNTIGDLLELPLQPQNPQRYPGLAIDLQGFPGVDFKQQNTEGVHTEEYLLITKTRNKNRIENSHFSTLLESKALKEFAEMRLNNDFLVRALKSSYSQISFLKRTNIDLQNALSSKTNIELDLQRKFNKKTKKNRFKSKPMTLAESKLFLREVSSELETYFTDLISTVLGPTRGFLRVPSCAQFLPVRLSRGASFG